ncbi:MAG: DUF1002 domain-containing protein [Anaerostipes sp.]|nr:DUF1002 domain-containing protein [Anaerostipes sp.]
MRLRRLYQGTAVALSLLMIGTCGAFTHSVKADSVDSNKKYLAMGADLTPSEKKKVMNYLSVDPDDASEYTIIRVTNSEEHSYLDNYLSKSVIGSRALSSVTVEETDDGDGIDVKTTNISYCTEDMYKNALATAGVKNAEVNVAGPFKISGTAALVGVMKAYEKMTGKKIPEESKDAATNELVTTGEVGENIGKDDASKLIASVKEKVADGNLTSAADIKQAITDSAEELNIKLSDEDKQKIEDLMNKISDLDLDVDQLKDQAKDIYDKISNIDTNGILDKIANFFQKILDAIKGFF